MSHLPVATHASVKHAWLTTPSSDTLFAEEAIRDVLTQVREDSPLTLLENLPSGKGGKGSASSSSTSNQWKPYSPSATPLSSSSSLSQSFAKSPCGAKRPLSSSPSRLSKVSFKRVPRSPQKKSFRNRSYDPAFQDRRLSVPPLVHKGDCSSRRDLGPHCQGSG